MEPYEGHACETLDIPGETTPSETRAFSPARATQRKTAIEDVTTVTGQAIKGPVASWLTYDGPYAVEHIAATSPANDLLIFYRSPRSGTWRVVNASREAGQKVFGPLASWITRDGPYTVEHVAGTGAQNDLLVFYWSPRNGRWKVVNASNEAGQKIAVGSLASWLTASDTTTVEHVAAVNAVNDLLIFYWSPKNGRWKVANASVEAGQKMNGSLTNWLSKDGSFTVEHVAGFSPSNDLLVFYWSPRHRRWQVVNASSEAGQKGSGALTSWLTVSSSYTVEHVAAANLSGDLLVFYWSPKNGRWRAVNATREACGEAVVGVSGAFQYNSSDENVEMLFARGKNDKILNYWWRPSLGWQAIDITALTGSMIKADPTCWNLADSKRIGASDTNGHLVVITNYGEERKLTDQVRQEYRTLVHKRGIRRKVLLILWDPKKPNSPRPEKAAVEAAVFGATRSVQSYFREISGDLFTIDKAATLGWYESDHPPSEYWPGGGKAGRDSGAEAIRKAAREFDFKSFDTNDDGTVTPDELGILFVLPGRGDGGGLNRIVGEDYTNRSTAKGITIDGVKITWIAEVSIGSPPGPGIVAHELSHLLLGHGDMYFTFFTPSAAGIYSIMDRDGLAPHFDPFAKLKLGWLKPRLILRTGRYRLKDIETHHTAWILVDPNRGSKEYFIVENRWPGESFDKVLPDRGLGVWHIMENSATYDAALPPPNVPAATWTMLGSGAGAWTRKGIRMIRPIQTPPFDDRRALWDGSEVLTGYDLLSNDPIAAHANLKWGDGKPSGFALRNISSAGPEMEVTIEVADF
jgi:M6 family metalloprotease-like protein